MRDDVVVRENLDVCMLASLYLQTILICAIERYHAPVPVNGHPNTNSHGGRIKGNYVRKVGYASYKLLRFEPVHMRCDYLAYKRRALYVTGNMDEQKLCACYCIHGRAIALEE